MSIAIGGGGGSAIKSIQRGHGYFYNSNGGTITITAVDTDKTMVNICGPAGMRYSNSQTTQGASLMCDLTNSTTLTFEAAGQNVYVNYYSYEVIEFE